MKNQNKLNRVKIGDKYHQSGYGRGMRKATIYLINGYAYAKDSYSAKTDFNPLTGDLQGYVRVNLLGHYFHQVSDATIMDKHLPCALPKVEIVDGPKDKKDSASNVEKLIELGILGDIRERLGAKNELDNLFDDKINSMDVDSLMTEYSIWKLGSNYWNHLKHIYDNLSK